MRVLLVILSSAFILGCGNTLSLTLWNKDTKLATDTNAGFSGNSARDPYFTDSLKADGQITDSIKGSDLSGRETFHPYETEPPK